MYRDLFMCVFECVCEGACGTLTEEGRPGGTFRIFLGWESACGERRELSSAQGTSPLHTKHRRGNTQHINGNNGYYDHRPQCALPMGASGGRRLPLLEYEE